MNLTDTDLNFVVRRLPKDVRTLLQSNAGLLYVGGGFIRDTIAGIEPKDLDILGAPTRLKGAAAALHVMRGNEGNKVIAHETDNAITIVCPPRLPVQFITRWTFANSRDALASFDFTVCQACIYFDSGLDIFVGECSDLFYPDLAARRLTYTFPQREEEAGGSMMRAVKFLRRGWNIQPHSLAGVMSRVAMKVDWERINAGRVIPEDKERAVAAVVGGLLREVDPLLVVDGLEPRMDQEPD